MHWIGRYSCLVFISTFGYTTAFGVFQDHYTRSHAASTSAVSWVGSTQLFLLIVLGLPAGRLLDMGYFRYAMPLGSIIYTFSLFMVSLVHQDRYYQIFLSQGIGMGIGAGILFVPAMAIQAHHWRRRRSLAIGVVTAGTGFSTSFSQAQYTDIASKGASIGGIVFPIMLNQLLNGSVGFAWGVRASAFLVLGMLLAANLLMKDNPAITAITRGRKQDVKALFVDIPYMLYIAACASLINAAALFGRIIPSMFSQRLGIMNILISVCFACGILILALFGIRDIGSVIVFAILYGFFSGAFLSVLNLAAASFSRNEGEVGLRMGMTYSLASFGALVGNPVDGALLGPTFPWSRALIFSAVTILSGTCILLVSRHLLAKQKDSAIV
ncbi:MFS general substrate transporter [Stereum hirsutum FP-91666 SS1]|uniref:MFS general substrate transporter n=1 Tax=Stereum hirsutum (strain FP-91666) TaxID=721885 RepID=UPI0004449820|nr:MFS general substrate transporter [Stereum hirsutum FP-91666 SS1]EIM82644.1 MFS general substrate transporter [Stereum hirsutum FP-91666 SS1]